MEVLIIGAGTTGLLLAHGLKQVNIKATVFERETADTYISRPREWGLTLHWGNEVIKSALPADLQSRIRETWTDPYYEVTTENPLQLASFAANTGDELFTVPIPDGMRVSRSRLRKLFSERIDIHYGKRLISIVKQGDTVTAKFSDGTSATGSLLVGCDGSHSLTREILVGKEAAENSYMDYSLFNFPCKYGADLNKRIRAISPIFNNIFHPDGWMFWLSMQDRLDPEDPETWSYQNLFSFNHAKVGVDLSTPEKRTAFLKSKAADCVDPWRTVLQAIPDDSQFSQDKISLWRPIDWSSKPLAGKVTLAGDAAHPMAPYRGQGFNNGLEDAVQLRAQLAKVVNGTIDLPMAIQAYEVEMRERGLREIAISEAQGHFIHDFDKILKSPIVTIGARRPNNQDVPAYSES